MLYSVLSAFSERILIDHFSHFTFQGGGIPHRVTSKMFHYLYSTAPRPNMKPSDMAALAGYGYGLPMSRLYARYFHGDLIVNSYDGYGTDAIVYLKARAVDAGELLPIFNKTSTKQYKASVPTADWTDPSSDMNSATSYKYSSSWPSSAIKLKQRNSFRTNFNELGSDRTRFWITTYFFAGVFFRTRLNQKFLGETKTTNRALMWFIQSRLLHELLQKRRHCACCVQQTKEDIFFLFLIIQMRFNSDDHNKIYNFKRLLLIMLCLFPLSSSLNIFHLLKTSVYFQKRPKDGPM